GWVDPIYTNITVQGQTVANGQQAIAWDLAPEVAGFLHLRKNVPFYAPTPRITEIDVMFRIDSGTTNSGAIGLFGQSAPLGGLFEWIVEQSGEVWLLSGRVFGAQPFWVQTGYYLPKNVWHHTRTVLDSTTMTMTLFVDGQQIGNALPLDLPLPQLNHAFTSVYVDAPGDERIYFDDWVTRERDAAPFLSANVETLPVAAPATATLRLHAGTAMANRQYWLVGSATGTSPGIQLPNYGTPLPLTFDWFTAYLASNPNGAYLSPSLARFDQNGDAEVTLSTLAQLPSSLVGLRLRFAYFTLNPIDAVSNAVQITLR
ncbi:MAG: hypothetical protein KDE27_20940, partial [Planctomycetes bacterium]|nr:hypothetical protein [Planctomycetota bacterium]